MFEGKTIEERLQNTNKTFYKQKKRGNNICLTYRKRKSQ